MSDLPSPDLQIVYSTTAAVTLTCAERFVADLLVACRTEREIAAARPCSLNTARAHIRAICRKVGCPGGSRLVLLHALLSGGHVDIPKPAAVAPAFNARDLRLLRALAVRSDEDGIAEAAGCARDGLGSRINTLIHQAGVRSPEQLIISAHGWGFLGDSHHPAAKDMQRRAIS